jgi:hypothetical protein
MIQKFLSRKLLVAVVAFITVNVLPNLSSEAQAKWSAFVAAVYLIAQGVADAFGSNKEGPSQGAA